MWYLALPQSFYFNWHSFTKKIKVIDISIVTMSIMGKVFSCVYTLYVTVEQQPIVLV